MNFEKLYQEAQANPVDFWDYEPTLADNIKNGVGSVLSGAYAGLLAKPSTLLGSFVVATSEKIDELIGVEGESSATSYLKGSLAATVKQTQLMQETAQNSGRLNATLYSMSDVLSTFVGVGKFSKPAKGMVIESSVARNFVANTGSTLRNLKGSAGKLAANTTAALNNINNTGGISATVGAIQGYADYEQGLAEGLDKNTAAGKALVSGGSVALGGYIPLTMGFKFTPAAKTFIASQSKLAKTFAYTNLVLQDVTYTAGANIALGVGQRGFTHEILKANGYDQMADQYKALDNDAMMVDMAFGLIFGGVAKYAEIGQQRYVDALLAKNNQLHQNDASIGIPTDIESLNMHDKALNKAFDDMINDRPVDVASILKDSNFILKHDADWQNALTHAIAKHFPDDALYYTKNGTPIPNSVIDEIKSGIISKEKLTGQDKKDIVNLNNGIIPKHLTQKLIDKVGLKASDVKESFDIYQRPDVVSDAEFNSMRKNATPDDITTPDAINQILESKPDMQIKHIDENGIENVVKASDLLKSVSDEVSQAQADKKLYDVAVACMLRNS